MTTPRTIYIMVSVDCEATQVSMKNPSLGEQETAALLDVLQSHQVPATLFALPSEVEAAPSLYRQARQDGNEVGLHIHPSDLGYGEFLGVYGPETQREILADACSRFERTMETAPRSFCPGYHSANDATYGVLADMGFTHGRVSLPGRVLSACASTWAGAPLDEHYAHRWNRDLPGSLDFVNLPHTIDPDSRIWGGATPLDLRVESVGPKDHWYTMNKALERQLAQETPVAYLSIFTHNVFDYHKPESFYRATLDKMLCDAKTMIKEKGHHPLGATFEQVAQAYRDVVARPDSQETGLAHDTRGRS